MPGRCPWAAWALPLLGHFLYDERSPDSPRSVEDTAALIQGSVVLHQASSSESSSKRLGQRWDFAEGGSTIGDVAPRILTEEAIEALRKSAERYAEEEVTAETGLSEASAETLAASMGVGLNRIMARLDTYLTRVTRVKDKLLEAVGKASEGPEGLVAFERAMNETLDVAQQGSATVAVVLRSSVSSTEANLESAAQRGLSSTMEDSLGASLSQFEVMSQATFLQAKDHVVGLSQDVASAAQRMAGLREALSAHRRQTNALGHALYHEFQDVASAVETTAEDEDLGPVASERVRMAFHAVEESAAAAAWKLYLPSWELAQSVDFASRLLGFASPAEAPREPLGGEITELETSPSKPPRAAPVTKELDSVEKLAEGLLEKTMAARKELLASVRSLGHNDTESKAKKFEAAVAAALAAVEPDWKALDVALTRTAKSITQCLETAGQRELSSRLESLFWAPLSHAYDLSRALTEPSELAARLDDFLRTQDVLAQSFFRTYHEFMNGLGHDSGGGVGARTISFRRSSGQQQQQQQQQLVRRDRAASGVGQLEVEGVCATLGRGGPMLGGFAPQAASFVERRHGRLDMAEQDEDVEVARRMRRRVQEVAFGSEQQAAAIAWRLHSAAWVLASGIRNATEELRA